MINITSTSNPKYKYIRSLLKKKNREENGEFTVEGIRSVRDACAAGKVRVIAVSEYFYKCENFEYECDELYVVKDDIFPPLCDTQTPQGILAVVPVRESGESFDPDRLYIYCDRVSDPGNAGTIIRTADAAGCGGVIFSEGSADVYSPKTVRASMGSFFHINIISGAGPDLLKKMTDMGFCAVCGMLDDDTVSYTGADMTKPTVVVVGNEAAGVSNQIASMCGTHVKIPIYGRAESLNAGVAASVIVYEAVRQREAAGMLK